MARNYTEAELEDIYRLEPDEYWEMTDEEKRMERARQQRQIRGIHDMGKRKATQRWMSD